MTVYEDISLAVQKGKAEEVERLTAQALENGENAQDILEKGLLTAMSVIGVRFRDNEIYVPEVLVAARAMNRATALLKPHLASEGSKAKGKVIIGTVKGDLHDIGKNLVKIMMEGKGLEVKDLGVGVPAERFVQEAINENADIICCSALLTSTMYEMKNVVDEAVKAGIREKVKIMIGGAPLNADFCREIGADIYTPDAATAADAAVGFIKI